MNSRQRRTHKRKLVNHLKWLLSNDPRNHTGIYKTIRKLTIDDLEAVGATRIEFIPKELTRDLA